MNQVIDFLKSQKQTMVNCLNEICLNNNPSAFDSFKKSIQKEINGMMVMYNAIQIENYIPSEDGLMIWQTLNDLYKTIESFEFSNKALNSNPDSKIKKLELEFEKVNKKIKNNKHLIWLFSIASGLLFAIGVYLILKNVN